MEEIKELNNLEEEDINTDMTRAVYDESDIKVLKGLEAVRIRPGMYIGSTGPRGLHHLVYEIVDNSIDEALAGICKEINIEILPDNVISVKDDGRGIPVGLKESDNGQMLPAVTIVLTVLHAGGKFENGENSGYKVAGGLHGVGSSVVNALSEWFEVEVTREGHTYAQRFERGIPVDDLHIIADVDENQHGTLIRFKADGEIFKETLKYTFRTLERRFKEQAYLNAGLKITFEDKREAFDKDPNEPDVKGKQVYCYNGGIKEFVSDMSKNKTPVNEDVIHISTNKGDMSAEIALRYTTDVRETIRQFANNIETVDGGTHVDGFKTAITKVFNNNGKRLNLIKDGDNKLKYDDVKEGLTAVISVKITNAEFEGQTKSKLGNVEMKRVVNDLVSDKLNQYFEENPEEARKILDKAILALRAREAALKAREAIRKKSPLESNSLPGKLADCTSKEPEKCELYIVEGDSAGGSAKQGRDPKYMAILPLWGKMLNVEKARADKVYGNEKLVPIIQALGTGIGEDFDVSKLRYHKIILMADADVDGAHITTLLLTFFFRHMPRLIEEGHVYLAQPPLFKVTKNRKSEYAFSDEQRDDLIERMGGDCDVQRYKGLGEMDPEQLWETTMDPEFRTMLRVTIDDAELASENFSLLMGEEVEPRRQFIEQNAQFVKNLDI